MDSAGVSMMGLPNTRRRPPSIQYLKSGGRNQVLALLLLCETALEVFFRCGNLRDGREYGSGVEGGAQYVGV